MNSTEIWKKVPYEELDYYEISTFGNVRLLPRDVPTHIVNRGRDMIVTAHRKGKDIKIQYDAGRPIVRMLDKEGHRRKFSLPLLMLKTFKPEECPGEDMDKYTAAYIDGDNHNNNLDNLIWISKAALMSSIASTIKGEPHPYLVKYEYIIIKVNNQIVGYFSNTTEGEDLFNSYGFETSASAITRCLKEGKQFYYMFDFESVDRIEYTRIALNYPQVNLKMIYDIIMEDRRHSRKSSIQNLSPRKVRTKTVVKKEVVEKVVYKPKIEKQIVEKIVYVDKQTGQKTRKPRVRSLDEEVKEKEKRLVNDRTTNDKETTHQAIKTAETKAKSRLDDIDDSEFYREQESKKKIVSKDEFIFRLQEQLKKENK